jgi:arylsulfatase A-like enzyme
VSLSAVLALAACSAGTTTSSRPTAGPQPAAAPLPRPNIVFVLTDDLTSNLVRFMPHVQAMRRRGTSFGRYFVTDSECCPSRASIFTGNFPHNTDILTNGPTDGGYTLFHRRREGRHTFATALARAGYRTGFFGKYLNKYLPAPKPIGDHQTHVPPGWSDWFGSSEGYRGYDYTINDNGVDRRYGDQRHDYVTDVLFRHALRFIRRSAHRHRPFFAEVAPYAPHYPSVAATSDAGRLAGLALRRPPSFDRPVTHRPRWMSKWPPLTRDQVALLTRYYRRRARSVLDVDRQIGRIEATLAAQHAARDTYLVFSSDNGYHLGQHRLTSGKMTAFDSDIKVPLVVTGPGVPAGRRVSAIAENIDLAPTFAALGHSLIRAPVDGQSLVGFLRGRHPRHWPEAALIEHHGPDLTPGDPDRPRSVRSGNPPSYEALRLPGALWVEYRDGEREYYDLRTDPHEQRNLVGRLGRRHRQRLHRELGRLERCHGQWACAAAARLPG